jgi:AAHS family 4-hydroxybenzoate transporter-like MFS transporter
LIAWLPTLINIHAGIGLTKSAGLVGPISAVGGMFGFLVLGYLIDRFNPARILAVNWAFGCFCVAAIGQLIHEPRLLAANMFLVGFVILGGQGALNAFAAIIYPTKIRVTGMGWAAGIGRLGGIIGVAIGGSMLAHDWQVVSIFFTAAVPAAVACAAILFVRSSDTDVKDLAKDRAV